jgi:ubiquinone/menaquinone biosynthesis C-methylase UbiE
MKSRGQANFIRLPGFAAGLYNNLMKTRAIERQYREIAQELASRIKNGRVLDIGTGPGKLLIEIYRLKPELELFGLDISEAMVYLARKNLAGIPADIQRGDIRYTRYPDDFFDLITCTGSFYPSTLRAKFCCPGLR